MHAQIDKLERMYVQNGRSVRFIARSAGLPAAEVRQALLDVGLEVEGEVKPGYVSSRFARCGERAHEVQLQRA